MSEVELRDSARITKWGRIEFSEDGTRVELHGFQMDCGSARLSDRAEGHRVLVDLIVENILAGRDGAAPVAQH